MVDIVLPNEWTARHYQADLFDYMFDGSPDGRKKRAVCIWHRRAGKDSFSLNFAAVMAHQRVGTYWHMLPTLQQGRRVVWDGIDKFGRRMIDQAFPKAIRASTNNSEMKIELKNGSIWQVVGSDNYDSLVGTNPVGVVFSEFSIADPAAWDYLRPILAENDGWAIFIYTPRGKNHGWRLYEMAKKNPGWYCTLLTIEDTYKDAEKTEHVIPKEVYQAELDAGMDPLLAMQEFYCSFDAGLQGAYYTTQLNNAEREGRIGDFPWIPDKPVSTVWDLGIGDDNFIIFFQEDGPWCRIIDVMRGSGKSMEEWIRDIDRMKYVYDMHWAPHDIESREYTTGKTRKEYAASLGIHFDVTPKVSLEDGISAARVFFNRVRINESTCEDLIDALQSYRREYDQKRGVFKERPLHDWASHGADAFRYLALAWEEGMGRDIDEVLEYKRRRGRPKVIRAFDSSQF